MPTLPWSGIPEFLREDTRSGIPNTATASSSGQRAGAGAGAVAGAPATSWTDQCSPAAALPTDDAANSLSPPQSLIDWNLQLSQGRDRGSSRHD